MKHPHLTRRRIFIWLRILCVYLLFIVFFSDSITLLAHERKETQAEKSSTAKVKEYTQKVHEISELLAGWRITEASQQLAELAKKTQVLGETGSSVEVQILSARLLYLKGDYDEAFNALRGIEQTAINKDQHTDFIELYERIQRTAKVVKGYRQFTSPHGWFVLSVRPGKDEILVPIAFKLLEKAYEKLTRRLGVTPPLPIRVEIYPSHNVLAEVSSLTLDEIRTSGTIALCKYNRIMVTTPSAQPYGYDWGDTLVHEFVHYLIHTRTIHMVPIWLHEGLAKYLERSWRDDDPLADNAGMQPFASTLLKRRIAEGKLISFEQMHPSMAKLPSQEDAATAFAQVHTLIAYVVEKGRKEGRTPLRKTLDLINNRVGAKEALARSLGVTFSQLEREWHNYMKTHPFRILPDNATHEERLTFREGALKGGEGLDVIKSPKAKDYAALAMLLQGRGFLNAALVEYRKSLTITGPVYPFTVSRMAAALNDSQTKENAHEAEVNLRGLLTFYPSFAPAYLQLGRALSILGERDEAIKTLEDGLLYNPFDPGIYKLLLSLYPQDEYQKRIRAEKALTLL